MTIAIEITDKCNHKCFFCDAKYNSDSYIMSTFTFEKIIQQISEFNIDLLTMSPVNGEVFVDKEIYEKFNILKKYKIKKVMFHTNLGEDINFELLKDYNFIEIHVSDYSRNGFNEFKKLTGTGLDIYKKTIDNKKKLLSSSLNYKLLDRSLDTYTYTVKENEKIGLQHYNKPCYTAWAIRIDPYGKVVFCNNSIATKDLPEYLIIGDINKDKLKNILNSSIRREYIKKLSTNQILDYCKVCNGYLNNPNEPTINDFRFLRGN